MRIKTEQGLSIAWLATSLEPPEPLGVFLSKATFSCVGPSLEIVTDGDGPTGDVAGKGLLYPSDFVPYKPRADIVVNATAHAPGNRPVKYLQVSIRVGGLQKQLIVAGDRRWQPGMLGRSPSEPEPFASMPVTWTRAFGGPKDSANPAGRGRDDDNLPNIEIPGKLVQSRSDRTPPAGFAPIASDWEPRRSCVGTYRGSYLKNRWPWYPEDFDFSYFNAAPRDQQVDGYLRGDEELAFENLHRAHPNLAMRLPGLCTRLFVTFANGEFREVRQRLDTLFVDLERERIVLVWRGHTRIDGPLMHEVVHVLAAMEPLGEPLGVEHYRVLRDAKSVSEQEDPVDPAVASAKAARAAALDAKVAAMEADLAEGEAQMLAAELEQAEVSREQGIDPAVLGADAPQPGIAAWQAQLADGVAKRPPEIQAAHPAAGPELSAEDAAEFEQLDAELENAKNEIAAKTGWTRAGFLAAVAHGDDLEGADLTGLDLAGCALAGVRLDRVVLANCDLSQADLQRTSLVGSVLTGAKLDHADLRGARLDDSDCKGATFVGAMLAGASMEHAVLEQQCLANTDLSGCRAEGAQFAGADLSGSNLAGADFTKADLSECKLIGADCSSAVLRNVRLHKADASKANFRGADLRGMRADDGASFADADFRHAIADGCVLEFANLHGADLRYASLQRALLTGADLGQCDLSRADLERASLADATLVGARLLQTNLRYACLERADCKGADLRWANLYGAGLWEAKVELADLRGANLASTLLGLR